jgi:hypothetical protein
MLAACSLDEADLQMQLERYRTAGRGATISRTVRRLVAELDDRVSLALVDQLVAVELGCCSFFEIDWQRERHRLTISVPDTRHEPALDAIEHALRAGADPR